MPKGVQIGCSQQILNRSNPSRDPRFHRQALGRGVQGENRALRDGHRRRALGVFEAPRALRLRIAAPAGPLPRGSR